MTTEKVRLGADDAAIERLYKNAPMFGSEVVRAGTSAPNPLAVMWQAPWEQQDGFAEHCRRQARALALACPTHLRGTTPHIHYRDAPPELLPILQSPGSAYSVEVRMMVLGPTSAQTILNILGTPEYLPLEQLALVNRCRVLYGVLERDSVGPDLARGLSRFGQVWVPCEANARALRSSGVTNDVRVVPMPWFDGDPMAELRNRKRRAGRPRFYHVGKWEPRKAQDKMLRAFLLAFEPGEAQLLIKTSAITNRIQGFPSTPQEALRTLLTEPGIAGRWNADACSKWIEIIDKRISHESVVALHRWGDVYLSLSRGEAVDMPAFDAKLAGNILVYTPSGGPQEFAASEDERVASSGLVPCHPFYGWEPEARYIDYDHKDEARRALRHAADRVRSLACAVPDTDMARFRAETVGALMRANLDEMAAAAGGRVTGPAQHKPNITDAL